MRKYSAIDAHQRFAIAFEVSANKRARGALQHANDFAGCVLDVRGFARDANHDFVAGRGVERFIFANEYFRLEYAIDRVRTDKAMPGRHATVNAGEGAVRIRGAEGIVATHREPPGANEFAHGATKLRVVALGQVKTFKERFWFERMVTVRAHRVQDFCEYVRHSVMCLGEPRPRGQRVAPTALAGGVRLLIISSAAFAIEIAEGAALVDPAAEV